jgi:hypothetical protein
VGLRVPVAQRVRDRLEEADRLVVRCRERLADRELAALVDGDGVGHRAAGIHTEDADPGAGSVSAHASPSSIEGHGRVALGPQPTLAPGLRAACRTVRHMCLNARQLGCATSGDYVRREPSSRRGRHR